MTKLKRPEPPPPGHVPVLLVFDDGATMVIYLPESIQVAPGLRIETTDGGELYLGRSADSPVLVFEEQENPAG